MRDRLDALVPAHAAGVRRREFAQCLAAQGLLLSACGALGQPASPQPQPNLDQAALRRACAEFEAMVFAARLLELDMRAAFVNIAINHSVAYAPDSPSGPAGDEWSTPFETLARGAGDCEDLAIAKFYLLIASGAPREGVRLLYAIYRWPDPAARPQPHLVTVAGWPLADPCVLDCINPLLVPLSRRDDLEPLFSFDQLGIWAGAGAVPHTGRQRRIERWQATQARTLRQAQAGERLADGGRMRAGSALSSNASSKSSSSALSSASSNICPCTADTCSPCLPPRSLGAALRAPQPRSRS